MDGPYNKKFQKVTIHKLREKILDIFEPYPFPEYGNVKQTLYFIPCRLHDLYEVF